MSGWTALMGWRAGIVASGALLGASAASGAPGGGADGGAFRIVTEQVVLFATVVGAIAALPALIEFIVERRKRRERIALSLDDVDVARLHVRLAGLDELLAEIADLIDRAREPEAYASLEVGNEILIIGPSLSGKKTLAQRIAKEAAMDRVITVYNARNADALARAKSLLQGAGRQKVMLLLPRIDLAFEQEDEEVLTELDALIEASSESPRVLVVGTAVEFSPDSAIDNLFGIKLLLPGGGVAGPAPTAHRMSDDVARMLGEVARFYIRGAVGKGAGFTLVGMTEDECVARILGSVTNPAEVEDIVVLCQTAALHRQRIGADRRRGITREILERSIGRVIVGPAGEGRGSGHSADGTRQSGGKGG